MASGYLKYVPSTFVLVKDAPEILRRMMFIAFLIFDSAVSLRAIIVDHFMIIVDRLTFFLHTPFL